jgi:K+-sensing histidine kinase KdpD
MSLPRGDLQKRTGIPAPVLKRLESGTVNLSRNSKLALYNVYRSENYRALRAAGIERVRARALSHSIDTVKVQSARTAAKSAGERGLDNYERLVDSGMTPPEAAANAARTVAEVKATAAEMRTYAKLIWKNAVATRPDEKITLRDIIEGLNRTVRWPTKQEIERYIKPYARGIRIKQPTWKERQAEAKRVKHEKAQEKYLRRAKGHFFPPVEEPEEETKEEFFGDDTE